MSSSGFKGFLKELKAGIEADNRTTQGVLTTYLINAKVEKKVSKQDITANFSFEVKGASGDYAVVKKSIRSQLKEMTQELVHSKSSDSIARSITKSLSLEDSKLKVGNTKTKATVKVRAKSQVRDSQGQFSSLLKIQTLINASLKQAVINRMGTPRLVNRTGTLAGSAEVTRVTQGRQGMISLYYTYERRPYSTFEPPGGHQQSTKRDPRALISLAVRDVAESLILGKFRTVHGDAI